MTPFGSRGQSAAIMAVVFAVTSLAASTAAFGRSAADDLSIGMYLAGGTLGTRTTSPFRLGIDVGVDSGPPQNFTLRVALPDGLRWGDDLPDPSEGCTGTAPDTSVRRSSSRTRLARSGGGWIWDVVADRPGPYEVTASVRRRASRSEPGQQHVHLQVRGRGVILRRGRRRRRLGHGVSERGQAEAGQAEGGVAGDGKRQS